MLHGFPPFLYHTDFQKFHHKRIFIMKSNLLSQKLKELRKLHNFTQDYVASYLGVIRQTYSHYETGKRSPDANTLYRLAGLYHISVDDLLSSTIETPNLSTMSSAAQSDNGLTEYLDYFNQEDHRKKYAALELPEKEMLFYFSKLSEEDQKEMIAFAKIKAQKGLK